MASFLGFLCFVFVVFSVPVLLVLAVCKFRFLEEGEAIVVTFLDEFSKAKLMWTDFVFDDKWNVVPGTSINLLGGLRFVGIRGFHKVYGSVSVKPQALMVKIDAAETEPNERVPLNALFQVFFRVANPFKYFFKTPPKLEEKLMEALMSVLRGWVSARPYDKVVDSRQNPVTMWEQGIPAYVDPSNSSKNKPAVPGLKDDPVIRGFLEDWGIEIIPNRIQIADIGFTKEYQDLLSLKEKRRLEAEALAKKVETIVMDRMAKAQTNGDLAEFKKTLAVATNVTLKQRYEEACEKLTADLLALDAGARVDIRGDGISATLDSLVTKVVKALKGP